tara:strand:- start:225 stop:1055 length:831 start_codon:yes stop_codon:yes gene_type:complete
MRNNQRRLGAAAKSAPSPAPNNSGLAFAVPTEFVELPSRGAFYPEGHPLHNQETVEIKFMTAKDEDILSSQALLKKGLAIDRLLDSLLVDDIDSTKLLAADRSAILIAARISAYGSEYGVEYVCGKCVSKNSDNYDLKEALVEDGCFDEKFLAQENIIFNSETSTFDFVLPSTGVSVGVSFIDGSGEKSFFSATSNEESLVTSMLASFLNKVNENQDPDYVSSFIEVMPAKDSKYLRDVYAKLAPAIRLRKEFECQTCLHVETKEVPLSAEFFWPR